MGTFNPEYIWQAFPDVIQGIPNTMAITLVAFIIGSIIGLFFALVKIHSIPVLEQIGAVYVSIIRGTPLLVQLFLIYYGLPILLSAINPAYDISGIPALAFCFVAFSLSMGAYMTELFRSSILAVDDGQLEAAHSVGMSTSQAMVRIILPQAMKSAIPNIVNQFMMLLKNTSLAFTAAVPEILGQAKIFGGRTSMFFEGYIAAAIVYWVLCFILEIIARLAERVIRRDEIGVAA
ncbi:amino acid ABC transporter permease [Bifidobacterium goeldii]|uniref:Amino acid ABC transporter permease n=2 Tax=Bifidobacterium goeldii TaxID=2306975 RepID=A0A430FL20_9BIFI|nr:amino acid ABC transporter permease [Bifidobacterium goeldii]